MIRDKEPHLLEEGRRPFHDRHVLRVTLERGGLVTEPVDLVVDFSRVAPEMIQGRVLGRTDSYEQHSKRCSTLATTP